MEFNISFTHPSEFGSWGELWLAGSKHEFEADFSYWNRQRYIESWIASLSGALKSNRPTALIVCMTDPKQKSCIDWWPVYPEDGKVYFRNAVLDLKRKTCRSDDQVFNYIPKRTPSRSISEWAVNREALLSCVQKLTE